MRPHAGVLKERLGVKLTLLACLHQRTGLCGANEDLGWPGIMSVSSIPLTQSRDRDKD